MRSIQRIFGPSLSLVFSITLFCSCNNSSDTAEADKVPSSHLKEDTVDYSADNTTMTGYVVYNDSFQGKRPAIIVVHEWWGLTEYTKVRAKQLADLGYIAMAVDMYGNGKTASNPGEAMQLAGPFYKNPQMIKSRIDAAIAKLKSYPEADTSRIAAIGYCYGGFIVLNAAKMGEPFKAVVSFHGDLSGLKPDKNLVKGDILICHGEADTLVKPAAVAQFKKQMDSAGVAYTFKSYPNAMHAFTNSAATEIGKKFNLGVAYNAEADKNSWNDMKEFFDKHLR
jgi:dienelactone hydrolase